jgi:hypothetical protein
VNVKKKKKPKINSKYLVNKITPKQNENCNEDK